MPLRLEARRKLDVMSPEDARSWPETFEVTVHTNGGASIPYRVMTWRHEEKAVALAASAHFRQHDQSEVAARISDIEVRDLGPAPRDSAGMPSIDGSLTDRMEW